MICCLLSLVSKGTLPRVRVSGVVMESEGFRINYTSDLLLPFVSASDQLIAFAKLAGRELRVAVQERGTEEAGSILIPLHGADIDEMLCCYVYAVSADGKKSSNSVWVEVKE